MRRLMSLIEASAILLVGCSMPATPSTAAASTALASTPTEGPTPTLTQALTPTSSESRMDRQPSSRLVATVVVREEVIGGVVEASSLYLRSGSNGRGSDPDDVTIENYENGRVTEGTVIGTNGDGVSDSDDQTSRCWIMFPARPASASRRKGMAIAASRLCA